MERRPYNRKPDRDSRSESALFNYERSLDRLGGDPALFEEIVILFLEDSPNLLEQARCALREQDLQSLARAAHSLKNLSANFDATALTQAAATVEQHAHDGELGAAGVCFGDMERELDRLRTALAQVPKTTSEG